MSIAVVARKDFQDSMRSRSLWVLSAAFLLFAVGLAYLYAEFPEFFGTGAPGAAPTPTMDGLVFTVSATITLFISLTAIVICYKSIAGERELGSIKLLLSLPHTRSDVVLGKVLGRSGVLAVPVLVALVAGTVLGALLLDSFALGPVLALLVTSLLFVLTYVSIVVGLSATTGSTQRASALAVGFFVVFELVWDVVPIGLVWATNGFSLPSEFPDWIFVVNQVPPSSAYTTGLLALVPDAPAGFGGSAAGVDAFYGTPWLGIAMLVLWLVVPLALGYRRFEAADL